MWKIYLFVAFIVAFLFVLIFAVIEDDIEDKKWKQFKNDFGDNELITEKERLLKEVKVRLDEKSGIISCERLRWLLRVLDETVDLSD